MSNIAEIHQLSHELHEQIIAAENARTIEARAPHMAAVRDTVSAINAFLQDFKDDEPIAEAVFTQAPPMGEAFVININDMPGPSFFEDMLRRMFGRHH